MPKKPKIEITESDSDSDLTPPPSVVDEKKKKSHKNKEKKVSSKEKLPIHDVRSELGFEKAETLGATSSEPEKIVISPSNVPASEIDRLTSELLKAKDAITPTQLKVILDALTLNLNSRAPISNSSEIPTVEFAPSQVKEPTNFKPLGFERFDYPNRLTSGTESDKIIKAITSASSSPFHHNPDLSTPYITKDVALNSFDKLFDLYDCDDVIIPFYKITPHYATSSASFLDINFNSFSLSMLYKMSGFSLASEVVRVTLELNPDFSSMLVKDEGIDFFSGMPFSKVPLVQDLVFFDKSPSVSQFRIPNLIAGLVVFGIRFSVKMRKLYIGKDMSSVPSLDLDYSFSIPANRMPKENLPHPVFSIVAPHMDSDVKNDIVRSLNLYPFKIGQNSVLVRNEVSNPVHISVWHQVDVVVAAAANLVYSHANRSYIQLSEFEAIMRAFSITPLIIQPRNVNSSIMPLCNPINPEHSLRDIMWSLCLDSNTIDGFLSLNREIIASLGIINQQINKPTPLKESVATQSNPDLQRNVINSAASCMSMSDAIDLFTYLYSPEMYYVTLKPLSAEPTPVVTIYHVVLALTFIAFFPNLAKMNIPYLHAIFYEYVDKLGERTQVRNFGPIRNGDQIYHLEREDHYENWIELGLTSCFFCTAVIPSAPKTNKLLRVIQAITQRRTLFSDDAARTAKFPRLYTSGNNQTNGGLYLPWEYNIYRVNTSVLADQMDLVLEFGYQAASELMLSKTVLYGIKVIFMNMKSQLKKTANALSHVPARLFREFVNFKSSIFYRFDGVFNTPIHRPFCIYDQDDHVESVDMPSAVIQKRVLNLGSALSLAENFIVIMEQDYDNEISNASSNFQPMRVSLPDPAVTFYKCEQYFIAAREMGRVISLTNYMSRLLSVNHENSLLSQLLRRQSAARPPTRSDRRYIMDLISHAFGCRSPGDSEIVKHAVPSSSDINKFTRAARILVPKFGVKIGNLPVPFDSRVHNLLGDVLSSVDPLFLSLFDLGISPFLLPTSPANRFRSGLYIKSSDDEHVISYQYEPTGAEVVLTPQMFNYSLARSKRIPCFFRNGVPYHDPLEFPITIFRVNKGLVLSEEFLLLLKMGFSARKFSFYIPDILYVFNIVDASHGCKEINAELDQILRYEPRDVYQINFLDLHIHDYITSTYTSSRTTRTVFPCSDITQHIMGAGFNVESKTPHYQALNQEFFQSGDSDGNSVALVNGSPKPIQSSSMSNLIPMLTKYTDLTPHQVFDYSFAQSDF